MAKRWSATRSQDGTKRQASKRSRHDAEKVWSGQRWYCDQCQVEVYQIRCPHCGKDETEEK